MDDIQAVADRIVRQFGPERVVLFGSHAEGTAGRDSDVDLLVVLPFREKPLRKSVEKPMKALLIHLGEVPPGSHDLVHLGEFLGEALARLDLAA